MSEIVKVWKTKIFKKLFFLLENNIDKNITEGCYFIDKYHWDNSDDFQFNKVISFWEEYKWQHLVYYISDYSWWWYLHSIHDNYLLNERESFRKNNRNEGELRYKILWKFPTNSTILKFIDKECWWMWGIWKTNKTLTEEYYSDINNEIKEPIDMNEDDITKVYNFLISIKK